MKHNSEADDEAFKALQHQETMIERLKNITTPEGEWNKLSEEEKKELNRYVLSLPEDDSIKEAWVHGWRGYSFRWK